MNLSWAWSNGSKDLFGSQLKNRPGTARASTSLSPGFHPGSSHTRDAPITQYEIANHKSEISFPPTPPRLAPPPVGGAVSTSPPPRRLFSPPTPKGVGGSVPKAPYVITYPTSPHNAHNTCPLIYRGLRKFHGEIIKDKNCCSFSFYSTKNFLRIFSKTTTEGFMLWLID